MTSGDTAKTNDDMWLTLHEASRAFDVSLATLHRRRKSGELESVGAFKDKGSWKIPRQGLARLGFQEVTPPLSGSSGDTPLTPVSKTPEDTSTETSETPREVQRLKDELSAALRRAEVAEAVARERDRMIDVQARELARLEAGPSLKAPEENISESPPEGTSISPAPKKSRWRRWLGA